MHSLAAISNFTGVFHQRSAGSLSLALTCPKGNLNRSLYPIPQQVLPILRYLYQLSGVISNPLSTISFALKRMTQPKHLQSMSAITWVSTPQLTIISPLNPRTQTISPNTLWAIELSPLSPAALISTNNWISTLSKPLENCSSVSHRMILP